MKQIHKASAGCDCRRWSHEDGLRWRFACSGRGVRRLGRGGLWGEDVLGRRDGGVQEGAVAQIGAGTERRSTWAEARRRREAFVAGTRCCVIFVRAPHPGLASPPSESNHHQARRDVLQTHQDRAYSPVPPSSKQRMGRVSASACGAHVHCLAVAAPSSPPPPLCSR